MQTRYLIGAVALGVTLAGCNAPRDGAGNQADNATAAASDAPAATTGVRPGSWNFVGRLVDVSLPGAPPAAEQQMKTALEAKMATQTVCITPAEANRPPDALFRNDRSGECSFANMTMAGGKLSGEMTCTRPSRTDPAQQTSMKMAISGSYTPTTYTIEQTATFAVPGKPDGSARMQVTGVRTGECAGSTG